MNTEFKFLEMMMYRTSTSVLVELIFIPAMQNLNKEQS